MTQPHLTFSSPLARKLDTIQRHARLRRQKTETEAARSARQLPSSAADMSPTPIAGWVRMRHGDHFSQWCKGALCVKLRTTTLPEATMHYAEVICGHATVERRQGAVLRAFGLSGAVCTRARGWGGLVSV